MCPPANVKNEDNSNNLTKQSFLSKTIHGSTEKTFFLRLLPKKCLRYCYSGAHTGAPLRLYLRCFHAFVGAGPVCPPASEMILDFANMSSKLTFLQCNHSWLY